MEDLVGLCWFYLRMSNIQSALEHLRLAEHDVRAVRVVLFGDVFDALEPHQVDDSRAVGEMSHQPFLATLAEVLERQDLAHQLHVRHRPVDFGDAVEAAAVDVLVRVIRQQIAHSLDGEFLAQQVRTLRTDALQILDVLVQSKHNDCEGKNYLPNSQMSMDKM